MVWRSREGWVCLAAARGKKRERAGRPAAEGMEQGTLLQGATVRLCLPVLLRTSVPVYAISGALFCSPPERETVLLLALPEIRKQGRV